MKNLALLAVVSTLGCAPAIELEDGSGDAGPDASTGGADDQGMSRPGSPGTSSPAGTTTAPPSSTSTTGTTDGGEGSEVDGSEVDEGGEDDCGCNFLCEPCQGCPDDPEGCGVVFECDPFAQDCPLGEKCMPWANDGGAAWNATRCSPIADSPGAPGEPCQVEGSNVSGIDDCALGATCWTVDPRTGLGMCTALCTGTADAPQCPEGDACFIGNDGALSLCLRTCDPLVGDCPEGQGCFPADATGSAHVCLPAPSEQIIAPGTCAHIGGCEPGTVCVGADVLPDCDEPMGCCTRWCDLQAVVGCAEGLSCQPAYPGSDTLGVCMG